eukprot:COSAG06_NODE_9_length_37879_cov_13.349735_1_plen_38_part_00
MKMSTPSYGTIQPEDIPEEMGSGVESAFLLSYDKPYI